MRKESPPQTETDAAPSSFVVREVCENCLKKRIEIDLADGSGGQARGRGGELILRRILGTNHGPTIHPTFVNFSELNNEQRRELKRIK